MIDIDSTAVEIVRYHTGSRYVTCRRLCDGGKWYCVPLSELKADGGDREIQDAIERIRSDSSPVPGWERGGRQLNQA